MKRFINTMVYGATALTLTVLATSTAYADGKGGHSGGHTSNSNGSSMQHTNIKPANQMQGQGQQFTQNHQVNQSTHNTMKQNFTQNYNHNNGSQFKKQDFKNFKKDYYWDKYCHDFGCYNKCWWNGWNYSCWDTCCYSNCGFTYPCFSFYPYCWKPYRYTLGYRVSPVFVTEVVVPEIVVPQLAVKAAVGPAIAAPAAKTGLTQNTTMDAIETVPPVDTSFITGSSVGSK